MIQIGDTLVSDELLSEAFVCDLNACKGACCVEGEYGAPLEQEEADELKAKAAHIAPYLSEKGRVAIAQQGAWVKGEDGDLETPLMPSGHCAYVIEDENKTLKCGLERVHAEGHINFKKPISCHLYPIRIAKYTDFEALNYDRWSICSAACSLGEELKVPVYQFLKEPLIRKYGSHFYSELENVARDLAAE